MKFYKMHGIGNDFFVVDLWEQPALQDWTVDRWAELARATGDRHFGVGHDGVLTLVPTEKADVLMRMFNPDGSEAEMCGNGVRCAALYLRERRGLRDSVQVDTLAGPRRIEFVPGEEGGVWMRVDMGAPRLAAAEIPVAAGGDRLVDYPLEVAGRLLPVTTVSMGNPHAVTFTEEPVASYRLHEIGPQVEHHPLFPRRTNFEVVNRVDGHSLTVRVWERRAAETLACGTGACAVGVAGILRGTVQSPVAISLTGGKLKIEWEPGGSVFMSGPARFVFTGEWPE